MNDGKNTLKDKWVFSFGYVRDRDGVDNIKSLVETSSKHGLNGLVLSTFSLDRVRAWSKQDLDHFKEIQALCKQKHIELIPSGFSVGYGHEALAYDPNFAAAVPVKINLIAGNDKLAPIGAGRNLIKDGDFELYRGTRLVNFALQDKPGKISFVDTDTFYSGKQSLRYENFGASRHGHGRIMQEVELQAGCTYQFSVRIKTENLNPFSSLQLQIYKGSKWLTSVEAGMKPTQDWTQATLEFVSREKQKIRLYAGSWGAQSGTFWVDDMKCVEQGSLASIVRREGTPLKLTSERRNIEFVEGKDYEKITNDQDMQFITLLPGTRIEKGEELALSFYKTASHTLSWGPQISLCMSNPDLFAHWEEEARALYEVHTFKKFLLTMDEIRNGGGCELCRKSGKSMAQILGECITKQYELLKRLDPDIEVYIWSDMFDPNHNARNNYYGVIGDFSGSWKYIPKDIIIVCWYHKVRDKSLAFFSSKGFRTAGACYYDGDDLSNPRDWFVSLQKTPGATGIMYTSWRQKYELLDEFGDLVSDGVHGKSTE
jgi:hypothetical protein